MQTVYVQRYVFVMPQVDEVCEAICERLHHVPRRIRDDPAWPTLELSVGGVLIGGGSPCCFDIG